MNIPFTTEQFLSIFAQYNRSVWPFQIFFNVLGIATLVLVVIPFRGSDRFIAGTLAFFWIWIGAAYHLLFFSSINPAAYAFCILNILQGIVFIIYGVIKPQLRFEFKPNICGIAGIFFVGYALVAYPLIASLIGHVYPRIPTFGLPCPTTIFTFGLLLLTKVRAPKIALILPVVWSFVGFSAALTMGMLEDVGLILAGISSPILIALRDKRELRGG